MTVLVCSVVIYTLGCFQLQVALTYEVQLKYPLKGKIVKASVDFGKKCCD